MAGTNTGRPTSNKRCYGDGNNGYNDDDDDNEVLCCSYRKSVVFVVAPKECCVVDDGFRMKPSLDDLSEFTDFMKRLFDLLDIRFHLIDETDQLLRKKLVLDIIKPLLSGNRSPTHDNSHPTNRQTTSADQEIS